MKKRLPLLVALLASLIPVFLFAQDALQFSPDKPQAGEKVHTTYRTTNEELSDKESVKAIVYLLSADEDSRLTAQEVIFEKEGNDYHGKFELADATRAFFVHFVDSETYQTQDNNKGKGYYSKVYTAAGDPVPGARSSLAEGFSKYARTIGIEQDYEKALALMQKEFAANPVAKNDNETFLTYAGIQKELKHASLEADVKERIAKLTASRKASEVDLMAAHQLSQLIEDMEETAAIATRLEKKYPKGDFAKQQMQRKFYDAKDYDQRKEIFAEMQQLFASDKETLGMLAGYLARSKFGGEAWDQFDHYISLVHHPEIKASVYNGAAWSMAGAGLEKEAPEPEKALELSTKSMALMEKLMANPAEYKRPEQTAGQYLFRLKSMNAMYADTYALALYRNDKAQEALDNQRIACERYDFKNGDNTERFAVYMEAVKRPEETIDFLEEMIRTNKATGKMKEQYERLFLANLSKEDAFKKHMANLEEEAMDVYREELEEKMLSKEAPNFTLVDLDGKKVSLADMRGKVVVLDFWAVWCGPCKASFPGMQMAIDKYKNRDDVAFLFINTWENNVEDKRQNALDYITKNDFSFHVLLDEESSVVSDYKVRGIPTKFIVDGNGKIRFESIGFDGNADKLVNELSIMIELAKKAGSTTTAARP